MDKNIAEDIIIEQIKPFLKEFIDLGHNFAKVGIEDAFTYVKDRVATYSSDDNLRLALKYAWGYEEKYCLEYSLEEAIKWFKVNLPTGISSKGCLLKDQLQGGSFRLHLCFIESESNIPLLDGNYPHLTVKALKIDKALQGQFHGKDMLIIQ